MTYWWERKAGDFQAAAWVSEIGKHVLFPRSASRARTAGIHTREDVVALVSLLSSVNRQPWWIVRLLVLCSRLQSSALVLANGADFCPNCLTMGGAPAHIVCYCNHHHRVVLANRGSSAQSLPMRIRASDGQRAGLNNQPI